MDDTQVGRILRAVRRRRGLRQIDVAALAGVGQSAVSLAERGHLEEIALSTLRRICRVLDVAIPFAPRWRGSDLFRLLDERHASIVETVSRLLAEDGWTVQVEASFNWRGERLRVDLLGWHAGASALLIVEVKSAIVDVQELLGALDVKRRAVPPAALARFGWRAASVGCVLVLPDESAPRRAVAAHASTFHAALPARTVEVRRWRRSPASRLDGIWFLSPSGIANRKSRPGGSSRVRRPRRGST